MHRSIASQITDLGDEEGAAMLVREKKFADLRCGGGFSLALTYSGRLYSWGNWSGGRLGLGPIPVKTQVG